jgi:hypothetical protein
MVSLGSLVALYRRKGGGRKGKYVPWHTESQLILYGDKPGEYTQTDAGCGEDCEDPDVELDLGPLVVFWRWTAGHCGSRFMLKSKQTGL